MRGWMTALGILIVGNGAAGAATLQTVFSFTGTNGSGSGPEDSLLLDSSGNLFGTTTGGGSAGRGTVFELTKGTSSYTLSTLLSFTGTNGSASITGLLADTGGNLYGTTLNGGGAFDGNAFELRKSGSSYSPTNIATFTGTGAGRNGSGPGSGLIADSTGNLFGTTNAGGTTGYGTVYELVKSGSSYTTTTLTTFTGTNGGNPFGNLVQDASGNLFGTANKDGPDNNGTVFELVKGGSGYTLVTLASFNVTNGANPYGGLLLDSSGNLFGTTYDGGSNDAGTAFELAKNGSSYTLSTLATFTAANGYVDGGLIEDAAGNLFGTTLGAVLKGGGSNQGSVFELIKGDSGYALNTLVAFNGTNGASPYDSLVADSSGNLFGTTSAGGLKNKGTVFEITGSGYVTAEDMAVPEPASLSLVVFGLVGAFAVRRRIAAWGASSGVTEGRLATAVGALARSSALASVSG